MLTITSLLAQMDPDTTQKITEIHQKLSVIPDWALRFWPLLILIAIGVALLFHRQKQIVRNQANLAQGIENLVEGVEQLLKK